MVTQTGACKPPQHVSIRQEEPSAGIFLPPSKLSFLANAEFGSASFESAASPPPLRRSRDLVCRTWTEASVCTPARIKRSLGAFVSVDPSCKSALIGVGSSSYASSPLINGDARGVSGMASVYLAWL